MFFPEFLLRLSQRDEQVTWLDPLLIERVEAVANVTVATLPATIPTDRALIIQTVVGQATPGAAQSVTELLLQIIAPGSNLLIDFAGESFPVVANQARHLNWSGSILIPPGWGVRARAAFDAGAAVNTARMELIGMFIPVGNIQRV